MPRLAPILPRVLPSLVLASAVLVAACGGDPTPDEATPPPAVPTTPAPEATTTGTPAAAPETPTATPEAAATPAGPVVVLEVVGFPVEAGSRPHDVAPAAAPDTRVWYTGQRAGNLGWLEPATGEWGAIALGAGSAPHGVIVGPDGAPWITDGGLNAIVRVDPETEEVEVYRLPADRPNANLNTAAFDLQGRIWFTGQSGIYGSLDPASGEMAVYDAPRGRGPYGITTTPGGDVYYASLAGSYLGRIDVGTGDVEVIEPPTANQGARRAWSDSDGRIWVSEWNSGQVSVYDPSDGSWREWRLPGAGPQTYSVWVDEHDFVWLTDFGANAIVRFDPEAEEFEALVLETPRAAVRQMLGRDGEAWGAESSADRLVVVRHGIAESASAGASAAE